MSFKSIIRPASSIAPTLQVLTMDPDIEAHAPPENADTSASLSEQTDLYTHHALDCTKAQIRLLQFRFSKADSEGPPSCDILVYDLDSVPRYHAL